MKRRCKCRCGSNIDHKHPNAKFLNKKHKDGYWNIVNPRGKYEHLNSKSHDIIDDMCGCHPFSSEALGQE